MPTSSKGFGELSSLGGSWASLSMDSNEIRARQKDACQSAPKQHNKQKTHPQRRRSSQDRLGQSSMGTPSRQSEDTRDGDEVNFIMPSLQHGQSTSSAPYDSATPRSRKPYSTQQHLSKSAPPLSQTHQRSSGSSYSVDVFQDFWSYVLYPLLGYILSVLKMAATYAKPLIAFALFVYVIFGLLIAARNGVSSAMHSALAPICTIPGMQLLSIPFCSPQRSHSSANSTSHASPVAFDQLVHAQAAFEDVLKTSAGGASLPFDMKRSEASIRDLRHVVEYSSLPSRHELVLEFVGFIETARMAATDLTRYNSRIGRAVDRILTTNRWTLQVLDGIAETEASRGKVMRFVQDKLNPFAGFSSSSSVTQNLSFDQYIAHTSAIEEQVSALVLEAQALLLILQNLDDRLDLIAGITQRDGVHVTDNRDALFEQLWTRLGGNRQQKNKYAQQLALLADVGRYRKMAWAHVSGTILKLQAIAANLEDLRERVARPEVIGYREEIPLEMHVREILMGVQRLEAVRDQGRAVEGEWLRHRLDQGEKLSLGASQPVT